jgi:hypothetical protein
VGIADSTKGQAGPVRRSRARIADELESVHIQHVSIDSLQLSSEELAILAFAVVDVARFGNTMSLHRSCRASRPSAARRLAGIGGRVSAGKDLEQE